MAIHVLFQYFSAGVDRNWKEEVVVCVYSFVLECVESMEIICCRHGQIETKRTFVATCRWGSGFPGWVADTHALNRSIGQIKNR